MAVVTISKCLRPNCSEAFFANSTLPLSVGEIVNSLLHIQILRRLGDAFTQYSRLRQLLALLWQHVVLICMYSALAFTGPNEIQAGYMHPNWQSARAAAEFAESATFRA